MAGPNDMRNLVLRFDLRRAPTCPEPPARRYRTAIEMACWADRVGLDVIGLSEHHCSGDGFLSAPLQLAGMMAARTTRIRISVSALLVPLHDPLRLAEDIAPPAASTGVPPFFRANLPPRLSAKTRSACGARSGTTCSTMPPPTAPGATPPDAPTRNRVPRTWTACSGRASTGC